MFEPIERFTKAGIIAGGVERAHDVVALATGFIINPFLKEIEVVGADRLTLKDRWSDAKTDRRMADIIALSKLTL